MNAREDLSGSASQQASLLTTKLYVPLPRPGLVPRPHLTRRLNEGLSRRLTLISAPAGFGKTTLLSEWVAGCRLPVAWVSLDEGDNDLARFLTYLVAALQTIEPLVSRAEIGSATLAAFQSAQPPAVELVLTALINEITALPEGDRKGHPYVLILDDYHVIEAQPIHDALAFLLDHLPPQMHLVIEPLSERELQVLQLMATGLSNQAIADELIIALGTVKAHAAAIYRKLDVNSRTQAVACARDLGILP